MAKSGLAIVVVWMHLLPLHAQQAAGSNLVANPGRPTVSTPATLTPVGYLQFETGTLGARHSSEFSSLLNINEVVKLTVAPRVELIYACVPIAHFHAAGMNGHGTAEEILGIQGVLLPGQGARPTLAASYFRKVYDGGGPDIDIGTPRQSFLFLASSDLKGFHIDTNYLANEMEQGTVRRAEFGQTLSIAHPLNKRFNLSAELWHFTQPFLHGHAAGNLWAVGYAPRSNLVFDVGFNRGLTGTSTRWEVFAGFTYLLPRRLWKQK